MQEKKHNGGKSDGAIRIAKMLCARFRQSVSTGALTEAARTNRTAK